MHFTQIRKVSCVVGAFILVLFSSYLLFYKLGNEPFQDYDEATYAEVTYESAVHHTEPALQFLNVPYFRKPPLLFWATAASTHIFPDTEFALRFPSALAGLLTILLLVLICSEAGASLPFALLGGGVLATTATWVEFARDVRFDNLVSLFITCAFYAGIRTVKDARWFLIVGIALGLAILSKSVIAVFGGIALVAFFAFQYGPKGMHRLLKDRYLWAGIGMFFLIAAPWHIYETIHYGMAFWNSYLGQQVLERASTNLFAGGNNPTNVQYAVYVAAFAAPWSELFCVLLLTLPLVRKDMTGLMRSVLYASCVTALSVIAVMVLSRTKAFGYLMPLYPFVAVAIALGGGAAWKGIRKRHASAFPAPLILGTALCTLLFAASLARYDALHINPYYGWELGQARDERAIGHIIRAAPDPTVYTYNGYSGLGSILYYSRLPDTPNQYILVWSNMSVLASTSSSFVLATSSLQSLSAAFPDKHFTRSYSGTFVSLFTVTD